MGTILATKGPFATNYFQISVKVFSIYTWPRPLAAIFFSVDQYDLNNLDKGSPNDQLNHIFFKTDKMIFLNFLHIYIGKTGPTPWQPCFSMDQYDLKGHPRSILAKIFSKLPSSF